MISVLGFEDDVIALSLSGVSQIIEVTNGTTSEQTKEHLKTLANQGTKTVFISQKLLEQLTNKEKKQFKLYLIEIPKEFQTVGLEKIDNLARETLGISLK